MIITSKDNEKIKAIKKLKNKKYRENKFIVEGIKMVREAIIENADIDIIVVRSGFEEKFEDNSQIYQIDLENYNYIEVTENVFNELTDVVAPQGILAVINKRKNDITIDEKDNFIIALDGIQDPGNLGTIIRTADAANLKQIIVSKDTADCYSPKVIRSTMGAIYRVNIIEVENLAGTLLNLKQKGFEIVTTELDATTSIYDVDYNKKIVIIGNEANGVSTDVRTISDIKTKIPMLGKTESLNASVAAGLMIYEYIRQVI